MEGKKEFVQLDHNELFPYLLVNIGSGVSMIKVMLSVNLYSRFTFFNFLALHLKAD